MENLKNRFNGVNMKIGGMNFIRERARFKNEGLMRKYLALLLFNL